ncbi:type IX secretion system membrane protein, PorP/SprF family [Tenacibaculum sp. MAR_2009_124]|uniref:PorP/SprF family type IX secretion system membrane protein n=1 Tax=Tenacibaculum sp. MAR_2009_124 TaxID=1250059 RepID=UPI000897A196|nr:type IX secretion system membrane protein PorP/SprF [Tenacibaculum sp. MAR_2009_124]SEC90554.1 type IX secretion system membrane protein, PorP/SprF family [Tenacibaculum sp. MAR_2009_124]
MKLFSKLICFIAVCLVTNSYGQQDPQFTQYMFNTMSVNPAYAGSRGHTVITALARTQWVGFDGAPDTQNLSYDSPIGFAGLGLGVNLVNDKIGPSSEVYFDANVSYSVKTGEKGDLAFGLRLGGRFLNIDWTKGNVVEDESLFQNNINGRFLPTIGAGVYYHKEKWYMGLSVPNFLRSEHYDANLGSQGITAVERMHFFFITGYVFDLNESIKFKPAALLKGVSGAPLSLDISANFLFNDKFRTGIAWRWDDSISALLGFQATDSLLIGYAYDLTTSNYNVVNSGTHEVMLKYEILNPLKYRSPRFF